MNTIYSLLYTLFSEIGFIPSFILILSLSFYIFWKLSKLTDKNRNSIFDMWLVSSIGMIIWSRISFIISNSDIYNRLFWFYLPYERYDSEIYLFRWLPWKYLAIWDKGLLFSGLIVGFLFTAIIFTKLIKKWDWKEMLIPTVVSGFTMISFTVFINGILIQQSSVANGSLILVAMTFALSILSKRLSKVLMIVYTFIMVLYTSYMFLSLPITNVDKINSYAIIFWFALSSLVLLFEEQIKKIQLEKNKTNIKKLIEKAPVKNKAIKVRK